MFAKGVRVVRELVRPLVFRTRGNSSSVFLFPR